MYTTAGFSDSGCGHRHASLKLAVICLLKRHAEVPYSDRTVRTVDESGKIGLTNVEETVEVSNILKRLRKESVAC